MLYGGIIGSPEEKNYCSGRTRHGTKADRKSGGGYTRGCFKNLFKVSGTGDTKEQTKEKLWKSHYRRAGSLCSSNSKKKSYNISLKAANETFVSYRY